MDRRICAPKHLSILVVLLVLTWPATLATPADAAPTQVIACGTVITESVKLANDVGPCEEDGLIIGASGITVDLGGHRVVGTYDPYPRTPPDEEGITFQHVQGSTVKNGAVTRFSTGIFINGGSGNRVTQMNVHDNIRQSSAGDGIAVYASDSNRIDKEPRRAQRSRLRHRPSR